MELPIDRIYKFASFNENSISALADQTVWYSNVESLNDPFEFTVRYEVPSNEDEKIAQYIRAAEKELELENEIPKIEAQDMARKTYLQDPEKFCKTFEKAIEIRKQEHNAMLNSLNVFSTSYDNPDSNIPHCENILMWAHYAVGFTGFCLQFSFSNFLSSIREYNPNNKIAYCNVKYVTESPELNPIDFIGPVTENEFTPTQYKHKKWDYEGELRFLSSNQGLHKYSVKALEKVYVGCKMPMNKQKVLIAVIRQYFPHVEIYSTDIDKQSYKVVTKKI